MRFFRGALLGTLLSLWCAALAAGAIALWRYSATPGEAGSVPKTWPTESPIHQQAGRATLVMLAHPHCPCTRASVAELERLMARGDADAWVLFLSPPGTSSSWAESALWKTAAAIPGVRLMVDPNGTVAKTFGAETSGHVLFYDAAGTLRFSGGITSARGHEGPSAGGDAISALIRGVEPSLDRSLSFGCPLHTKESAR